mmetsp:Transcript_19469/g.45658  ORF Transcript_19469/g.45658 Transcript_19469/m.45658 type:complete len:221 (-) Transcript_19469:413-1075(-)
MAGRWLQPSSVLSLAQKTRRCADMVIVLQGKTQVKIRHLSTTLEKDGRCRREGRRNMESNNSQTPSGRWSGSTCSRRRALPAPRRRRRWRSRLLLPPRPSPPHPARPRRTRRTGTEPWACPQGSSTAPVHPRDRSPRRCQGLRSSAQVLAGGDADGVNLRLAPDCVDPAVDAPFVEAVDRAPPPRTRDRTAPRCGGASRRSSCSCNRRRRRRNRRGGRPR